ncbi:MAG: type II secretion system F family protein [Rickettsiales bacterium]|nr:type II secretion system F family protein [Rickettsiales bacterium]
MILKLEEIIALVAALGFLWFIWDTLGGGAKRRQMQKRVQKLKKRSLPSSLKNQQDVSVRRKAIEDEGLIYWLSKPLPDIKRLNDMLVRAGKKTTTRRYLLMRLLNMVVITVVIAVVFNKPIILAFCIAIILGLWLPIKWLRRTINKQNKAFLKLFPDAIDLIVRGLRSGLPVSESMVVVAREVPDPVGMVFTTIVDTMKLGVPLEKALQDTAQSLELTEFNFFVTSIVIQRETGGNLAEILSNLSDVLRGRFMMQMKIKAMSSEATASTYIIGALPFVVFIVVSFLAPDYMVPLYQDYRGNISAGVAAFMLFGGVWIMKRMARFEI